MLFTRTIILTVTLFLPMMTGAEAVAKDVIDLPVAAHQSSVGQGVCKDGKAYWRQYRRSADGKKLCSTYSWSELNSIAIDWKPAWNCDASKYYCKDTAKSSCFDDETAASCPK